MRNQEKEQLPTLEALQAERERLRHRRRYRRALLGTVSVLAVVAALAVLRDLGLPDDAAHVNPHGGAIALGHPLGASGGRLAMTAAYQLRRTGGRYALCTMCIGVGQGIALIIERV